MLWGLPMARILFSATFQRPWSAGHGLCRALEKTGHTVRAFDTSAAEDPDRDLLRAVDAFQPHLHVVHGGQAYAIDLVRQLADRQVFNVLWYPWVTPEPPPDVVELAKAYDLFLTMADGLVEQFRSLGARDTQWLPEAMEPSLYCYDQITDVDRSLFTCDVTLIGKLESDNPAYLERWKLVKRVVDEGLDIKWWGPRIRRRIGTFVLGLLLSKVSRVYGGRFVWNETYAKAVHLAKIFIARDAYPSIRLSLSDRTFAALGLGAFYLTFPTNGIETLFRPGEEIVTFNTPDQMIERIRYYLDHEAERTAIAAAAQQKVLAHHTYQQRFEQMFDMVRRRGLDLAPPAGQPASAQD